MFGGSVSLRACELPLSLRIAAELANCRDICDSCLRSLAGRDAYATPHYSPHYVAEPVCGSYNMYKQQYAQTTIKRAWRNWQTRRI